MTRAPSDPTGLAAAAAALPGADRAAEVEAGPAQPSLFGALPADPDGAGALDEPEPGAPRGRGRPPGSRNRSTDEWARYIGTRYRSPLIGLAEIAQATPAALQAELGGPPAADQPGGVTLAECLRIIMQAQASLAPYLHQKQPTAIDGGGVGMLTLIIEKGEGRALDGARILPIEESEQFQALENPDRSMSE